MFKRFIIFVGVLARRTSYAVSIGLFILVFSDSLTVLYNVALVLDFPIAVVGRLLLDLDWVQGKDMFFGLGVSEWQSHDTRLFWHLRATIIVYLPFFYAFDCLRWALTRYSLVFRSAGSDGE